MNRANHDLIQEVNIIASNIKISTKVICTWVDEKYFNPKGYIHWSWDLKLWSRPYEETVAFLEGRFRTTLDEVEYYLLMPYLKKLIPDSELLTPFRESPQYLQMLGMANNVLEKGNVPNRHLKSAKNSLISPYKEVKRHGFRGN